ncbi:MAG: hypothetical protein P8X90_17400 [Desulfobacterales bacterium]
MTVAFVLFYEKLASDIYFVNRQLFYLILFFISYLIECVKYIRIEIRSLRQVPDAWQSIQAVLSLPIPGNLLTTAMAVLPHTDPERALKVALSMDIPFWPQLPRLSYYEDMYVQASEHFPGIVLDSDKQTLAFSMDKFIVGRLSEQRHFCQLGPFDQTLFEQRRG